MAADGFPLCPFSLPFFRDLIFPSPRLWHLRFCRLCEYITGDGLAPATLHCLLSRAFLALCGPPSPKITQAPSLLEPRSRVYASVNTFYHYNTTTLPAHLKFLDLGIVNVLTPCYCTRCSHMYTYGWLCMKQNVAFHLRITWETVWINQ